MNRRRFLRGALAGLLAAPLAAEAQPRGEGGRLGWRQVGAPEPRPTFRDALRELGYVEGRNVRFDVRSADGKVDEIPRLAAELVALPVDVLVAVGPTAIRVARQSTTSVPIVMAYWGGSDP